VPPVRGARSRACSTKHTLIETIENGSFFRRLGILLICNWLEISARQSKMRRSFEKPKR
jgi:hypothetical protein